MPTPTTIPFSSIVFGDRERTKYNGIDELAQSIADKGLEQPIILSPLPTMVGEDFGVLPPKYLLEAGGRRYRALELLGVTELHHATTCDPGKPGFILKSDVSSDSDKWMTELIENMFREDFDWRDALRLLVKAYKAMQLEAAQEQRPMYYRIFGKMVGVGYSDIQAAMIIHDDVVLNPERYAQCNSILQAYKTVFRENQKALEAELAERIPGVKAESQPGLGFTEHHILIPDATTTPTVVPPPTVPLRSRFTHGNSLDYLSSHSYSFDHIICDPDFAVDTDRLGANMANADVGVAQASVGESLDDLRRLMPLAFRAIKDRGFFVFWYDLDHHEKLQLWASAAGFRVQRWPIIWRKVGFGSNAAPAQNICKNIEYAMVCAKPGTVLAQYPQLESVISLPVGTTTKDFGHPFAKPIDLWLKLYSMFCNKGETVFDPFMGRGSAPVAALRFGLQPYGCELQEEHYNGALLNLQTEYRRLLGPDVLFS